MADFRPASPSAPSAAAARGIILPLPAIARFLHAADATVVNVSITALVDDLDTGVTADTVTEPADTEPADTEPHNAKERS